MTFRYKVKATDSWSTVAKQNNLSAQQLMQANPGVSSLSTGMGIQVPQYSTQPNFALRGDSVLTGSYDTPAPIVSPQVSGWDNLVTNIASAFNFGSTPTPRYTVAGVVNAAQNAIGGITNPNPQGQVAAYQQQQNQLATNAQMQRGVALTDAYNQRYGMTEQALNSLATGLQAGTLPQSMSVAQAGTLGITQELLSMGYTIQNGFLIAPAQQTNTTQSGTYYGTIGLGGARGLGGQYGAAGDKWVTNSQAAQTAWRRRQMSGEEHLTYQERKSGKLNPEHQKMYDERFGNRGLVGFGVVNFGVGTG